MNEYLVAFFCFAVLIFLKFYLLDKSYKKKLISYVDPEEFAEDLLAKAKTRRFDPQYDILYDTDKMSLLITINLTKINVECKKLNENIVFICF